MPARVVPHPAKSKAPSGRIATSHSFERWVLAHLQMKTPPPVGSGASLRPDGADYLKVTSISPASGWVNLNLSPDFRPAGYSTQLLSSPTAGAVEHSFEPSTL